MSSYSTKLLKISHNKIVKILFNIAEPRKSNVTLLIGPKCHSCMNGRLLNYLSNYLVKENVNVVRFDYPFVNKKIRRTLGINSFETIYRKVFHFIEQRDEFRNNYFFVAGESSSAIIASKIISHKIRGYIFLGYPQKAPFFLKIPLPNKLLFELKKPMFFIQGTNDEYSDNEKIELLVGALKPYARLMLIPEADHSLELLSTNKRSQENVDKEIADVILWFLSDVTNKLINKN